MEYTIRPTHWSIDLLDALENSESGDTIVVHNDAQPEGSRW